MTAKEWMKVPRALRDHAIGKCASLSFRPGSVWPQPQR